MHHKERHRPFPILYTDYHIDIGYFCMPILPLGIMSSDVVIVYSRFDIITAANKKKALSVIKDKVKGYDTDYLEKLEHPNCGEYEHTNAWRNLIGGEGAPWKGIKEWIIQHFDDQTEYDDDLVDIIPVSQE